MRKETAKVQPLGRSPFRVTKDGTLQCAETASLVRVVAGFSLRAQPEGCDYQNERGENFKEEKKMRKEEVNSVWRKLLWQLVPLTLGMFLVLLLLQSPVFAEDIENKLSTNDGSTAFVIQDSDGDGVCEIDSDGCLHIISDSTTEPYVFVTSHTVSGFGIVVSTSGKVGIGTATPATKLDVNGTGTFGKLQSNNYYDAGGTSSIQHSLGDLVFYPDNKLLAAFEGSSGNVYLGDIDANFNSYTWVLDQVTGMTTINHNLTVSGTISGTNTYWDDAYDHILESGASHSYINQDVTTTASPEFADVIVSSNLAVGTTISAAAAINSDISAAPGDLVPLYGVYSTVDHTQTVGGAPGQSSYGGYFLSDWTGSAYSASAYGVYGEANSTTGDGMEEWLYGGYFVADGDLASGSSKGYGIYATSTNADMNYGVYSAAGMNVFNGDTRIGSTTPPNVALDVVGDVTATGTGTFADVIVSSNLAVGTTISAAAAINSDISAAPGDLVPLYGVYSTAENTSTGGAGQEVYGGYFLSDWTGSAYSASAYGVYGEANSTTGDGVEEWLYGGYFVADGDLASGTSKGYGIYATSTNADMNYGVYSAAGMNVFNGYTRIGSTTPPNVALDVVGDVTATGTGTFGDVNITDESNGYQVDGTQVITLQDGKNVWVGNAGNNTATTFGNGSVGIGEMTLNQMTMGCANVGIGAFALTSLTEGGNNIGIGESVMGSVTTGDRNIGIGYMAGTNITTGNRNICIGNATQTSADDADDELNIGGIIKGNMASGSESVTLIGQTILIDLPTSDPSVVGALWNDNGTVKISAGL